MENHKVEYLQMIQSVIERMSTSSAIFKGFSATIIAGVIAIDYQRDTYWGIILSFIPFLTFFVLDIYYLRLEKRYRFLFDQIRAGKCEIDFNMTPPDINSINREGKSYVQKVSIKSCLRSPSIYLFYYPLMIICIAVIILKYHGVIS